MAFISCTNGDLTKVFVTEADIIDQYVGNQLWLWGIGTIGRLGSLSTTARSSPIQTVSTGFNWVQVSTGGTHTAAIKTDGTLWLWGEAGSGELGNNAATDRSSPVQTVSTGANWKQVSLSSGVAGHSAAIKTDGTLWLWGIGAQGQIGDGAATQRSSPVQTICTGTNWKQVDIGESISSAIKSDGTLWVWGNNNAGRLGNNSTISQSSPVQTVSQTTNWKQVSIGASNSSAIKTDGTLWLWGCNICGILGNNSTIDRSSPVQTVATGTNWKQVSVGQYNSAAIKIDGTLWLWGNAANGGLGNNSTINQSSPVQTIVTGTNWKQVTSGISSGAIKNDGTLWVWGCGACGRLGNNSTIDQSSPVQTIVTGTNWKQVSSGTDVAATPQHYMAAVTHTEN